MLDEPVSGQRHAGTGAGIGASLSCDDVLADGVRRESGAGDDPPLQRALGRARVVMAASPAGARLKGLHQSGSAKVFLPRNHADHPEIVLLNTAGGLTGGDRLEYDIALEPGARATVTTQTAERAYRAGSGVARMASRLTLGAGTDLAWLPQEVILFERCDLARSLEVDMAADARLLFVESVVLGRQAMGEFPLAARLTDRRRILREGRLVLAEQQRIDDVVLASAAHPALLGPATALAVIGLIAPDAEARLPGLRARLADGSATGAEGAGPVEAAASAWDGKLVCRMLAADPRALRGAVIRVITLLTGAPMPRVWQA